MNAPANVLSFYAQAHWGSGWGVEDAFHKTPHKGLDVGLFHGIIDVPALHDGTVVAVGSNSLVGHYVTVQRADGLFETYCHIVPGVKVGQAVKQGDRLGRQATNQQEGGLQWMGQHTHFVLSRTRGGWGTWPTLDPTPSVIAVLTGTAGSNGTPIDNGGASAPRKKANTMEITHHVLAGVGEFYMFTSPTIVSLSPELSTLTADNRKFQGDVAIALAALTNQTIESYDDTPNKGWYIRNQLAARIAGMPSDFPLSPTNPYRASGSTPVVMDWSPLLAAIKAGDDSILSAIANAPDTLLTALNLKRI